MDENSLIERLKRHSDSTSTLTALSSWYLFSKHLTPEDLVKRLGTLRGPLMKVAQLLSMVPDLLPEPYAQALSTLQSHAPPMGGLFVKRRLKAELGDHWQKYFSNFNLEPFAAASIGQVHWAQSLDGTPLACKLQYPNMESIVDADLSQFQLFLSLYEMKGGSLKTDSFFQEIKDHLAQEISYKKEASHIDIFTHIFKNYPHVSIPSVFQDLSTDRLLTMTYMKGRSLEAFSKNSPILRNQAAQNLFFAWYYPLYAHGYLHGDPHGGNYLFSKTGEITLLDFGCVRRFSPSFVKGVYSLYEALKTNNQDLAVEAYTLWGFTHMTHELCEILNIWARFLYGPLLDNRVRPISESSGGREGKEIIKDILKKLKAYGKVELPREFVLMDRVAVGMGSAFTKLNATLNWHQMFEEMMSHTLLSGKNRDISQDI